MTILDFGYPVETLWFSLFQRRIHYLALKSFDLDPTRRKLFQKRVMHTIIDIYGLYAQLN